MNIKKSLPIILICLISLTAGIGFRLYKTFNIGSGDILNSLEKEVDINNPNYSNLKEQGKFNILLLGEDNVEGSSRSDTILFITVDIDDKNIKVLSLPRDTRVRIPGHGMQKLNHAFAYGGQDLLKATVEKYLDEPILYYVIVDYKSFPAVVDSFGGVEIDVEKRMRYVDKAGHLDINIQPGLQTMDGKTALHYVRFRKDAMADIGRVQRQQKFLKALLKKAYTPAILIRIPEITTNTMKFIRTDMSPTLTLQLAGFMKKELKRENIYFSTLHGQPVIIDKLSYWIGDIDKAKKFITSDINDIEQQQSLSEAEVTSADDKKEEKIDKQRTIAEIKSLKSPIAILNGTGESGLGTKFSIILQNLGIDVIHTGNAKHFDYRYSNIIYPVNADKEMIETARTLGKLFNTPKNLIRPSKQARYVSLILGIDNKELEVYLKNVIKTIQE